jgi:hypothetical protein
MGANYVNVYVGVVVVGYWDLAIECMYEGFIITTTQIILDINSCSTLSILEMKSVRDSLELTLGPLHCCEPALDLNCRERTVLPAYYLLYVTSVGPSENTILSLLLRSVY